MSDGHRREGDRLICPYTSNGRIDRHLFIAGDGWHCRDAPPHRSHSFPAEALAMGAAEQHGQRAWHAAHARVQRSNIERRHAAAAGAFAGKSTDLAGQLCGWPVVIVGAGPSLSLALPHLRELARRAFIVATTSAARAVARVVRPDAVVALDPFPSADMLEGADPRAAFLGPQVAPSTRDALACPRYFADVRPGDVPASATERDGPGARISLPGQTPLAVVVARQLGAPVVALVGCDCALGPAGDIYAPAAHFAGAVYGADGEVGARSGSPGEALAHGRIPTRVAVSAVPAWRGTGTVPTVPQLEAQLAALSSLSSVAGGPRLLNCTGGGAAIPGWPSTPIADLLALPVRRDEGAAIDLRPRRPTLRSEGRAALDVLVHSLGRDVEALDAGLAPPRPSALYTPDAWTRLPERPTPDDVLEAFRAAARDALERCRDPVAARRGLEVDEPEDHEQRRPIRRPLRPGPQPTPRPTV